MAIYKSRTPLLKEIGTFIRYYIRYSIIFTFLANPQQDFVTNYINIFRGVIYQNVQDRGHSLSNVKN